MQNIILFFEEGSNGMPAKILGLIGRGREGVASVKIPETV